MVNKKQVIGTKQSKGVDVMKKNKRYRDFHWSERSYRIISSLIQEKLEELESKCKRGLPTSSRYKELEVAQRELDQLHRTII